MKNNLLIIFLSIYLSGCGIGVAYKSYEDIDLKITEKLSNDKERFSRFYTREPLETITKDDYKILIFENPGKERTGTLYFLFPIPFPMSDKPSQIEAYMRNNKLFRLVYKNAKLVDSGFGFVCSPEFWGGDFCRPAKGQYFYDE